MAKYRLLRRSHTHQYRGNFRPGGCADGRCVQLDLPAIGWLVATKLFVGFEIYHRPAIAVLEGEVDDAFNEYSVRIAPDDRRFTTTPASLRGAARLVEKRLRQSRERSFRGGIDLFFGSAEDTAMDNRNASDRVVIAIERHARKRRMYQRA
jgi:hypothetical protein